ncbi:MAG: outer membrane protein transport protein [Alistipes sp.]
MKKFLLLAALLTPIASAFAEGYQVNTLSAKQTGMGHVGTAMKLNSESIFFNPAATAFQNNKFDISVGLTGIVTSATYRALPTLENGYKPGVAEKSDNKISTPIYAYFNYKPTSNLAVGVGFFTPNGSSMNWDKNWSGAHLVQGIDMKSYTVQPTLAYKFGDKVSIGAGLMITWGNFNLSRAMLPIGSGNKMITGGFQYAEAKLNAAMQADPTNAATYQAMIAKAQAGAKYFKENLQNESIVSADLKGDAKISVGVNAGILWNITNEWSVGMSYRSRMNMKVGTGHASMNYASAEAQAYLGLLNQFSQQVGGAEVIPSLDKGTFNAELPLPTSVTWGVSFRPTPKWEFAVDLQWVGWSAYKELNVAFNEPELEIAPINSVKNYSNTLAFRFGAQYRACDWLTARMGMYVDESPVSSNYLNPETPSMTKVSYTAGLSFRPAKYVSIDLAYCFVSSADPERTGSYPIYNYQDNTKLDSVFSGNYKLHAHVFSFGVGLHF